MRLQFSPIEERNIMKTKLVTAGLLIGALMAPAVMYAADGDQDRSSPTAFVKDSYITSKIKALMVKDKYVAARHIKVDTDDRGVVSLSGRARSQSEVDRAVSIARSVKGVVDVNNNIEIGTD
jgi:hyperosmotically inducible protein